MKCAQKKKTPLYFYIALRKIVLKLEQPLIMFKLRCGIMRMYIYTYIYSELLIEYYWYNMEISLVNITTVELIKLLLSVTHVIITKLIND